MQILLFYFNTFVHGALRGYVRMQNIDFKDAFKNTITIRSDLLYGSLVEQFRKHTSSTLQKIKDLFMLVNSW